MCAVEDGKFRKIIAEKVLLLIDLIREELQGAASKEAWFLETQRYFENTTRYIAKKAETTARFKDICK